MKPPLLDYVNPYLTPTLLLISAGWILLAFVDKTTAVSLTRDNNIIQRLQVVLLIATAFYCFSIVKRIELAEGSGLIKAGFSIFLLLTVFLALEEISWGQRILGIETPEAIKAVNVQNELTFHNHVSFQRYRHWLLILFGTVGLLLFYLEPLLLKLNKSLGHFTPPVFLKSAFFLVLLSGLAREITTLAFSYTRDDTIEEMRWWSERYTEIGELNVAIAALLYAYYKFHSLCLRKPDFSVNTAR